MSESWTDSPGAPIPEDADIKNRGRYGKYWDKKANVKARRSAYGWFIVVAIVILALAIVDILVLQQDVAAIKFILLGALAILCIVAILMLFSGTNEFAMDTEEEKSMEAAILQCPECRKVFEFEENHFRGHKKSVFTCPYCGTYGALPGMDQRPIERVVPEDETRRFEYECTNCKEEIVLGSFGKEASRASTFRNCPHCDAKGTVQIVAHPPPIEDDEDED